MARVTVEMKAKEQWGTTTVPQFCTYLLKDGSMLNGSYEGFQRDIDHREINQFLYHKPDSKNLGSSYPYIYRFMKRGNIRMSCNEETIAFEFWKTPTREQWLIIKNLLKEADELGLDIYIEKYYPNQEMKVFYNKFDFIEWLTNHAKYYIY